MRDAALSIEERLKNGEAPDLGPTFATTGEPAPGPDDGDEAA